jgi:membrane protein DedA with SNARE-associated domain
VSDWIVGLVRAGGYPGIVFLMTVENVFPPIPSELIMPLAGYLAARDQLTLWGAILAGAAGSVAGALVLYYFGARVGGERIKRFAARHGRWAAVSPEEIERAEQWFARHGWLAVLACRLVPGVRSLISIPAGMAGMSMPVFVAASAVGTALWATLLGCVGYYLGRNFDVVEQWIGWVTWAVIAAIALWYVARVRRSRRRAAA